MKREGFGIRLFALSAAMLLLIGMFACTANAGRQGQGAKPALQLQTETDATTAPVRQAGALDVVLLDDAAISAVATSYEFVQGERIRVEIAAKNGNGNPAAVWLLLADVNGWDVRNQQQSMQAIRLDPGEEKTQAVVFDLTEEKAQFLRLGALTRLTFITEGYVDSTDYEFAVVTREIAIPDAPPDYVQAFGADAEVLLDNDWLTVAHCQTNAQSGEITLYYAVKKPVAAGQLKLYPLENGVFDTQRYPALDGQDMTNLTHRLISFVPADQEAVATLDGFYAVAEGVPMRPARLMLRKEAAGTPKKLLAGMQKVAESEVARVYYDGEEHRFLVENRTQDHALTLQLDAEFLLDGLPVRANPQSVLCFPQSVTAFRISGRGTDASGVERIRVIDKNSQSASVGWSVWLLVDGVTGDQSAGSLSTGEFTLLDG